MFSSFFFFYVYQTTVSNQEIKLWKIKHMHFLHFTSLWLRNYTRIIYDYRLCVYCLFYLNCVWTSPNRAFREIGNVEGKWVFGENFRLIRLFLTEVQRHKINIGNNRDRCCVKLRVHLFNTWEDHNNNNKIF